VPNPTTLSDNNSVLQKIPPFGTWDERLMITENAEKAIIPVDESIRVLPKTIEEDIPTRIWCAGSRT
jgi:hypothetical protein